MAALTTGFGDGEIQDVEDSIGDGVVPALQDQCDGQTKATDAANDSGNSGVSTCAACGKDSRT